MNAEPQTHPAAEQLAAYGLGKLNAADTAAVAGHLETCAACRHTVQDVPPDSFIGLVRSARPAAPQATPAPGASPSLLGASPSVIGGPAPLPSDAPPAPPELAGHPRFRVVRELGRGGMGVVYLAEHRLMERPVALKVISKSLLEHPEALARFRREVKAAAKLDHKNIVRAYDAEQAGDLHLLVMEYVEGLDLARVLERKGPLPVPHSCHYVRQAALGLQHAHERGMVHRDLKPHNLMLVPDTGLVKILDFGLARLASERQRGRELTGVGAVMGTPEYIAPEQATDARTADIRADVYSLGCTLYCLLAGRPPFQEATAVKLILAHLDQEATPLHKLRPDVPAELSAVVGRMMAKDPAQRFQVPKEVAEALATFIKPGGKPAAVAAPTPKPVATTSTGTVCATDTDRIPSTGKEAASRGPVREVPAHVPAQKPPAEAAPVAPAPSVWEDLTADVPAPKKVKSKESAVPAPAGDERRRVLRRAAAVAVLALGALLLAGVIVRVMTRNGTVVLEIDPPDAEVEVVDVVDGPKITVRRPGQQEPIVIEGREGRAELLISKGGFKAETRAITVYSGKTERIQITLVPIGTLLLLINQPGAEVFVDGRKIDVRVPGGREPVTVEATPGGHELRVTKDGFRAFTRQVTVQPGKPEQVNVPLVPETRGREEGWVSLFNGKNLEGWQIVLSDPDAHPARTFSVREDMIVVTGEPNGYVDTDKRYQNFTLRYEWRYPRPIGIKSDEEFEGNSGLFIHIQPPHKVWPRCLEVQGLNSAAGTIVAIAGAKGEYTFDKGAQKSAVGPIGQWNAAEVICKDGEVTSKVNGTKVSTGNGELTEGSIGFASQGAEIHYRNIQIKELPPTKTVGSPTEATKIDPKLRHAHQNRTGDWKIEGDELVQASLFADCQLIFGDFTWKDYDFSCEAKKVGGTEGVGLLYHATGAGYSDFFVGAYSNKVVCARCTQRGITSQLARRDGGFEKDRWYKLRVRLRGAHCQCFLDDELVFEHEDTKNTQGAVGFWTWTTSVRFKNIRVTAPDGKVLFEGLPDPPLPPDEWLPTTEPASPSELFCLKGHGAPVPCVAFFRDGRHVLSASSGDTSRVDTEGRGWSDARPASTIRLWNGETGTPLDCSPVSQPVWTNPRFASLSLASGAPRFLSAVYWNYDGERAVRLWGLSGGKLQLQRVFSDKNRHLVHVTFTPDGLRALALADTGSLWEWNIEDRKLVRNISSTRNDVSCAAIAPDCRVALLARRNEPFA
jgi:predicted Ser/Thr protein kinase